MSSVVRSATKIVGQVLKPMMPKPPELPKLPDIIMPESEKKQALPGVADADAAVSARESEDARLKKKGRASFVLGGAEGFGTPKTAVKKLLGE